MPVSLSSLRRRCAAVGVVAATLLAGTVAAAPAQANDAGFYSVPYSSTLYTHFHGSRAPVTYELPYEIWRTRGFPTPIPAPTEYVRYAWSPDIHAVSYFDGGWIWARLTPAQWQRAGYPQARIAGHIQGTEYFQLPGHPEIYAGLNGVAHELTLAEWGAAGHPRPVVSGYETFKLGWTDDIAAYVFDGSAVTASVLTFEEWQAQGAVAPWVMPMLPGDVVADIGHDEGPDLYYVGATFEGVLGYDQWAAAGFPAPTGTVDLG